MADGDVHEAPAVAGADGVGEGVRGDWAAGALRRDREGVAARAVKPAAWLAACAGALALAGCPLGPLPPLGPFLDPVRGVWNVAEFAALPPSDTAAIAGLEAEVRVVYDDRLAPHVFASSAADAHRALGYVVARDRLFQMEVQTRATAGTLSEWVGPAALAFDGETRRLGLGAAAARDMEALAAGRCSAAPESSVVGDADRRSVVPGSAETSAPPGGDARLAAGAAHDAVLGYAQGVNAWIGRLRLPAERPFEYYLLGARPARWEPVNSLHVLKRMGWVLTFDPAEVRRARVAGLVGEEAADALFPADNPVQEPVVPHRGARFSEDAVPPPGPGPSVSSEAVSVGPPASGFGGPRARFESSAPVAGSNSWAVGPGRSESGHAILAGDPHLGLSLPSIWYEAHLVVPGELDVYGVTLAGVPAVVIGFNRDVAWTFTNTGADVMDLYLERVDDDASPRRYFLDGQWQPLEARVERFLGPDGRLLAVDTVRSTHRGPLLDFGDGPASLRWTVLEECGELRALMRAQRARSVPEWLEAMSSWGAPAQVGLVADRHGGIAVQSAAHYPVRPPGSRGDAYYDGTTRQSDWRGRATRYPLAADPPQGYLASANQQPLDPETTGGAYFGSDWPDPWRAMTINQLLRSRERHGAADFEAYQTHPTSVRVRLFRDALLAAAGHVPGGAGRRSGADSADAAGEAARSGGRQPATSPRAQANVAAAARLLASWDGTYAPDNERAVLFEEALAALDSLLWDELNDENGARVATPRETVALTLASAPGSPWWDDRATPEAEDRDALLRRALVAGLARVRAKHGREDGGGWAWSSARRFNVHHLLRIPGLSRLGLAATGGPGLPSPLPASGAHGASWRMVVELGDEVTARGTFPGGQSGNPLSDGYDDRLAFWLRGELEDLRFPRTEAELRARGLARAELVLEPAPR